MYSISLRCDNEKVVSGETIIIIFKYKSYIELGKYVCIYYSHMQNHALLKDTKQLFKGEKEIIYS